MRMVAHTMWIITLAQLRGRAQLHCHRGQNFCFSLLPFLYSEGGSPNATLVVVLVIVVINSVKIPKAFLVCSTKRNETLHTRVLTFPTDIPSQIFKLISN